MIRKPILIVLVVCGGSPVAVAHHSRAAYDLTQESVIEGTVTALAWKNPHIFMTVATKSPGGEAYSVEIEGTSVSEAQALGLSREAIATGAAVVVRAHPGRGGPRARAVGITVTTRDGFVYPLNTDARLALRAATVRARGIAGRWAPTIESFDSLATALQAAPLTEAARETAANRRNESGSAMLGFCEPFPPPVLGIFPDLRTIEASDETLVLRFEGGVGVPMERIVHLGQERHPADVAPSLMGHSIGRWDGDTLVIDTVAFTPHPVGTMFFPSGPSKHLVERLTLEPDGLQIDYSFTIEDPAAFMTPVSYSAKWDHRPDLQLSGEPCDPEVARRAVIE